MHLLGGKPGDTFMVLTNHWGCGSGRPVPSGNSGLSICKSSALQVRTTRTPIGQSLLLVTASKILAEEAMNNGACFPGSTCVFLLTMISQKCLAPLF